MANKVTPGVFFMSVTFHGATFRLEALPTDAGRPMQASLCRQGRLALLYTKEAFFVISSNSAAVFPTPPLSGKSQEID